MAKKKTARRKMPVAAAVESEIRHIQIQLPADAYERGKQVARSNGLSMAAYVRQAILQRIREDLERTGGGAK
jgi:hypothetical protein